LEYRLLALPFAYTAVGIGGIDFIQQQAFQDVVEKKENASTGRMTKELKIS